MDHLKEKTQEFFYDAFKKGFFNGCWLFLKKGEVVSHGALGTTHPYRKTPLNEDSVFELASVSKHFTATAIMVLHQRGELSIDDPISKYFPDLPYNPEITVKNLMNHTSGLPDYMDWIYEKCKEEGKNAENTEIVRFLHESGLPAVFEVGEKWSYCNTAYCLLALIVEKVSGKSFTDFMREEIFLPCGMKNTCVYHRRLNGETIENYAYGMVPGEEGEYVLPDDTKESGYVVELDGAEGDGIVNTNIGDMLLWDRAMREGTILTQEIQAEMRTPTVTKDGEVWNYGYGWFVDTDKDAGRIAYHGGGWPGYKTWFGRLLDEDSMIVCLTNCDYADGSIRGDIIAGLRELLCGRTPEPVRSLEEKCDKDFDIEAFRPLLGEYEEGVLLYEEKGALMFKGISREEQASAQLVPLGGDRFFCDAIGRLTLNEEGFTAPLTALDKTYKKLK